MWEPPLCGDESGRKGPFHFVKNFASAGCLVYPSSAVSSSSSGPIRAVAKFFFEGDRKFFVKGVTYGPFRPDKEGHYLGPPDQVRRDLGQMREVGLNVVRIYHVPPGWFLDSCAEAGMRVLITLPWEKH